jgi:drug/metabolite transporter (DMT)-like permease
MERWKIGLFAGLLAVLFTTVVNILGRRVGLLPEPMDMKYMAEFLIDPAQFPAAAFALGIIVHLVSGGIIGIVYVYLIKSWTPITGMLFMVADWLVMMLVLFPLTGRGFFGSNIGPVMAVATFILNLLYGAAIGWLAGRTIHESRLLKGGQV